MTRSFARFRWPTVLLLAPIAVAVVYVAKFATATPLTDEWIMLGAAVDLHKHGWTWHALRMIQFQHDQHLMIVPYLIYFPVEELFHFDTRALIAVSMICYAVQLAVFRLRMVKDDLAAFPIALLLFSPAHYMEFHWGFQFVLTMSVTFPVVALAVLDRIGDDGGGVSTRHYVTGTVLLVLGALCAAPGYFGFLAAVVLVTLKRLPSRTKILLSLSWLLSATVIYFGIAGVRHSGHFLGVRDIFFVLTGMGGLIWGTPVGMVKFGIGRDSLTGLALMAALIAVLAHIERRRSLPALPIALISFGVASIAAVAITRSYLGNWHLQLALPAVCGIYAVAYMVWRRERSRFNGIVLSCVTLILLLNVYGSYRAFRVYGPSYRAYVGGIEQYILSYTPTLEKPFPHPGDRDIDAEMIEFLREKHHPLFKGERRR